MKETPKIPLITIFKNLTYVTILLLIGIIAISKNSDEDHRFTRLYKKISPSVVQIDIATGLGSGVFITEDTILTNNHVVDDEDDDSLKNKSICLAPRPSIVGRKVLVEMGSDELPGTIIFADPGHDIALVHISNKIGKPVNLGDSKNIHIGDRVFSIGSSLGETGTLGVGYISNLNRHINLPPYTGIIQISTGVFPGNSGGGLFDSDGKLIGIVYAGNDHGDNMGFVIPINMIEDVLSKKKIDHNPFCQQ